MNANTDQRKIDWMRIISAYSIPMIALIAAIAVAQHRLVEAEGKIETKVSKEVHTEVHKAVDVEFEDFEQEIVDINARIEQVNYDAIQRHDSAMQLQRVATEKIIQAIKDK